MRVKTRVMELLDGVCLPVPVEVHEVPEGTSCLEVVVKAHRSSCAMLDDIPGACDCKPSVGATSVRAP